MTTTVLSHWQQRKEVFSSFMESLPHEVTKEVAKESGRLFLPLLTQALGGIGGVHWLCLGFSFIAWSLDNIDKTKQNQEDYLRLLKQTFGVLKNIKVIWDASTKDHETLKELQDAVDKSFQCAIICTCNLKDSALLRFLKASNAKEAMDRLKEDLSQAIDQTNNYIWTHIYINIPKPQRQVIYQNLADGKVDRGELKEAAIKYLKNDCNDIVGVCLHGMGGIGKSTLALIIFSEFQKKEKAYRFCMVELPFGIQKENLTKFQEQIIEKVCNHKSQTISSTIDGRTLLQEEFQKIKNPIFLYLDNVLEAQDLKELIPMPSYFPEGSRILVTTRHMQVYNSMIRELKIEKCELIEVGKLNEELSKKLLWHNIGEQGKQEDMRKINDLEERVLTLCDGLPLALRVVGSYIASSDHPTDPDVWKKVVEAMEEAKDLHGGDKDELYSPIKFSIESLEEGSKASFLDIAIFGVGETWEFGKRLVGDLHLEVLCRRALLQRKRDDYYDEIIEVHDVLQAMAKKMAREDNHDIRITSQDQFEENIGSMEKMVALEGVQIEAIQLMKMQRLRFLLSVCIEGECQDTQLKHLVVVNSMESTTSRPFNLEKSVHLKELCWSIKQDAIKQDASNLEDMPNMAGKEALHCFPQMRSGKGLSPDAITYACTLKACGFVQDIAMGERIHDEVATQGLLEKHVVLGAALVDMYAKGGALRKLENFWMSSQVY